MDHYLLLINTSITVGFFVGMIIVTVQMAIDDAIQKRKRKKERQERQDKLDEIINDLESIAKK